MKNIFVAAVVATLPAFAQEPQGGSPMPPPCQGQPACQMIKIVPVRGMQGLKKDCPAKAGRSEAAPFMKGFEKGFEAGFESGFEAGMKAAHRLERKGQKGQPGRHHGSRPHGMKPGCPVPPQGVCPDMKPGCPVPPQGMCPDMKPGCPVPPQGMCPDMKPGCPVPPPAPEEAPAPAPEEAPAPEAPAAEAPAPAPEPPAEA